MTLSARDRRLARLTAAVALGDWDELARLRASAPSGEPDRAWREAMLQTHLFAGFPRAVEAYAVLARAGGLGALEPGEALAEPDRAERGAALFAAIYAESAPSVRGELERAHPDFARWIEGHAYGRVLARDGLAAGRRELCAVAALAVLGQERQLASHARGALRCGATADEVDSVLACVRDLAPERVDSARRALARLR